MLCGTVPSSVQVSVYLLGVSDDWRRLMSVQRWAWYSACHKNAAAAAKSLQSCPTLRPHRRQPTRLPHTWDSPGKNTAVGCHSLLQCMKVKSESEVSQACPNLNDPMDCSLPAPSSWDFPDKSTGAGCDCLLHCDTWGFRKCKRDNWILINYRNKNVAANIRYIYLV